MKKLLLLAALLCALPAHATSFAQSKCLGNVNVTTSSTTVAAPANAQILITGGASDVFIDFGFNTATANLNTDMLIKANAVYTLTMPNGTNTIALIGASATTVNICFGNGD